MKVYIGWIMNILKNYINTKAIFCVIFFHLNDTFRSHYFIIYLFYYT